MQNQEALFVSTFKNVIMNLNGRVSLFHTDKNTTAFMLMDDGSIQCHRTFTDHSRVIATLLPTSIDTELDDSVEFAKALNSALNGNLDKFEGLFN